MAEGLGTAASILAVIQLSAQMTAIGCDYINRVRRAPEGLVKLTNELKSLSTVLTNLEVFERENRVLAASWGLDEPLKGFIQDMGDLKTKLELKKTWLGIPVSLLQWPLREKETQDYILRVEALKSLFLLAMSNDQVSRTKLIERNVQQIDTRLHGMDIIVGDIRTTQVSGEKEKDAFRIEASDKRHTEISDRRQKGTGQWILSAPEIQEWRTSPQKPLVWGYGIPGAGKTFLSSLVIDNLQEQAPTENYGVAYIYFNYSEKLQQTPRDVLSSLVKQLASQVRLGFPKVIEDLYNRLKSQNKRPTLDELYFSLSEVLKSGSFAQTFVICDALDECEREQRVTVLPMLHRMGKDGAKIFLTSRGHPEDIRDSLQGSLMIELLAKEEDIASYIERKIAENPRAKRLIEGKNCQDKIISELTKCSQGMFLLVHFHIEHVCQQTTSKQVLMELEKIKNSSNSERPLNNTYDKALQAIQAQSQNSADLAIKVFTWLLKAQRVLTIRELQLAVSMKKGQTIFDRDDLPDENTILDVCASLVTIDKNNDVRFVHYTAQEYLRDTQIIPGYSDIGPAIACATFLSLDIFDCVCDSNDSLDSRRDLYPLIGYAALYLPYHLKKAFGKDERLLSNFFKSIGNISSYVQALEAPELGSSYIHDLPTRYDHYAKGVAPIHAAACLGESTVVIRLLDSGVDLETADSLGRTALFHAEFWGQTNTTCMLLHRGADLSVLNLDGATAVRLARSYGKYYESTLLPKGVSNPKSIDNIEKDHREFYGYEIMIERLLEKGADFSSVDRYGNTAVKAAVLHGYMPVVKLLLKKGFDFSSADNCGVTPLHTAAGNGDGLITQLLLEKGADPSPRDNLRATPMHIAARCGHESVVQLLLEGGADPSLIDNDGRTASQYTEMRGNYYEEQQQRYLNDDLS